MNQKSFSFGPIAIALITRENIAAENNGELPVKKEKLIVVMRKSVSNSLKLTRQWPLHLLFLVIVPTR